MVKAVMLMFRLLFYDVGFFIWMSVSLYGGIISKFVCAGYVTYLSVPQLIVINIFYAIIGCLISLSATVLATDANLIKSSD